MSDSARPWSAPVSEPQRPAQPVPTTAWSPQLLQPSGPAEEAEEAASALCVCLCQTSAVWQPAELWSDEVADAAAAAAVGRGAAQLLGLLGGETDERLSLDGCRWTLEGYSRSRTRVQEKVSGENNR